MITFTEKDYTPPKEKLPNKTERKIQKAKEDEMMEQQNQIRDICTEFYNEKLSNLDIPIFMVKEHVPSLMRTLISLAEAKTVEFRNYVEAKKNMEDKLMKDLVRDEQN